MEVWTSFNFWKKQGFVLLITLYTLLMFHFNHMINTKNVLRYDSIEHDSINIENNSTQKNFTKQVSAGFVQPKKTVLVWTHIWESETFDELTNMSMLTLDCGEFTCDLTRNRSYLKYSESILFYATFVKGKMLRHCVNVYCQHLFIA